MNHLLLAGSVAGAVISLATLALFFYKFSVWFSRLNASNKRVEELASQVQDLVGHELKHNSGSSMKDQAKKAADLSEQTMGVLADLNSKIDHNQATNVEWQLSVSEKLGNHEGRLHVLESKQ